MTVISEFPEHSAVLLTRDVHDDGVTFPKGTRGIIVSVHGEGIAYTVEFNDPVFAEIERIVQQA